MDRQIVNIHTKLVHIWLKHTAADHLTVFHLRPDFLNQPVLQSFLRDRAKLLRPPRIRRQVFLQISLPFMAHQKTIADLPRLDIRQKGIPVLHQKPQHPDYPVYKDTVNRRHIPACKRKAQFHIEQVFQRMLRKQHLLRRRKTVEIQFPLRLQVTVKYARPDTAHGAVRHKVTTELSNIENPAKQLFIRSARYLPADYLPAQILPVKFLSQNILLNDRHILRRVCAPGTDAVIPRPFHGKKSFFSVYLPLNNGLIIIMKGDGQFLLILFYRMNIIKSKQFSVLSILILRKPVQQKFFLLCHRIAAQFLKTGYCIRLPFSYPHCNLLRITHRIFP